MGLTYRQAKELGIGHLHPAASGGKSPERDLLDRIERESRPRIENNTPSDGMNKTERAFSDDVLMPAFARRDVTNFWREPVKFRLAGRTWYTPDFMVLTAPPFGERLVFVEIKGFMRDDAAVKLKVAAETYPQFAWLLVTRQGRRGWRVRPVTSRGIGADCVVSWINGG